VLIESDTALTPDQGATGGSTGVTRGGVQIRQAAATARDALLRMAAERTGKPAAELEIVDGVVRPKSGGAGIAIGDLIGDRHFALKLDPKAKLKDPASYRIVGKPLLRPDVPGKVTGRHVYVHDFAVEGMLHGRVIRPPAVGATLTGVDERSIANIPGARAWHQLSAWSPMTNGRRGRRAHLKARSDAAPSADAVRRWMPGHSRRKSGAQGRRESRWPPPESVSSEYY
jgi:CO/xanthine dehydrogenase Mo-binding subunit